MNETMNVDDWSVPAVDTRSVTLVSGRDFAICDGGGDMVRGAVHGLIHHDRRYLDCWSMSVARYELRRLASTTPTPFHAVFVARLHEFGGRPLPVLIIRRRWVGDGMREVVEIDNSGSDPLELEVTMEAGGDFGHLFDVKSGRPSLSHATVVPTAHGLTIECTESSLRTAIDLRPSASGVDGNSWTWHFDIGPHERRIARITVDVTDDDADPDEWPTDDDTHAIDDVSHERHRAWEQRVATIVSPDPRLSLTTHKSLDDLASLRIFDAEHPDRVVVAAGAPWYMTLFGRDSLLTSYMALPFAPELARGVLRELAELQGRTVDPSSGEEPGKILHELRSHGGTGPFRTRSRYYGTVDATPLFVLVAAEALRWGALSATDHPWLVPAIDAAIAWIGEFGDSDGDGFIDYAPHDELGLTNQGWKDSWDGVTFADGSLPEAPIALVEAQGYTYAALLGAAGLYDTVDRHDDADRCRCDAHALRDRFDAAYWDDRGFYVEALDGSGRRVDSLGSNPGHALWTGIASPECADRYLDALAGQELWTGWGVRTLATSMGAYDPLSYHNGSVWPHDTAIAIAGAARYGRWDVVDLLTDGLLDTAMNFGGRLPELFAGISRRRVPVPVQYPGSCSPQAWAAGSVLLALRANLGLDADVPGGEITIDPGGALVRDFACDGLVVGDVRLAIEIRNGDVTGRADGMDIVHSDRHHRSAT